MPLTTHVKGSSGTATGNPVACCRIKSILLNNAPPPVKTIPLSTISAANSGGVFSKATFTASTIWDTGSVKASEICA